MESQTNHNHRKIKDADCSSKSLIRTTDDKASGCKQMIGSVLNGWLGGWFCTEWLTGRLALYWMADWTVGSILNGWLDCWLYTEWLTGRLYLVVEKPRMDGNTTSSVIPFSDCLGFKPTTCDGLHSRGRLLCGVRKHIQRHLPSNQASGGGHFQLQTGGSWWVRWKMQKRSGLWKGLIFSKRVFN